MGLKKEDVKIGDTFMSTYGCTMHRATYWQVVDRIGGKVFLGHPKTSFEATGYDCGYEILVGKNEVIEPVKRAKFTASGLKLCDDNWKAGSHYWDLLKPVDVGHREYTYGD